MMTIEVLICDKCGHVHRFETDIPEHLKAVKEKFVKDHERCVKKNEQNNDDY